ncbi:hypothetical protein FBU59_001780 [Linderina macrospora]|uniref:Uncharacterized protein n=1 Tax=Linderina macrospora TaxID=4868 RepID=A0ACC1JDC6_9FUNG|nr:hypothetical protein FBU59_001780 [Linderina macrospora]
MSEAVVSTQFSSATPIVGPDSVNKAKLRSYLNHRMKVTCSDGRQFVGVFKCVDYGQNLILADTTEHRKGTKQLYIQK